MSAYVFCGTTLVVLRGGAQYTAGHEVNVDVADGVDGCVLTPRRRREHHYYLRVMAASATERDTLDALFNGGRVGDFTVVRGARTAVYANAGVIDAGRWESFNTAADTHWATDVEIACPTSPTDQTTGLAYGI